MPWPARRWPVAFYTDRLSDPAETASLLLKLETAVTASEAIPPIHGSSRVTRPGSRRRPIKKLSLSRIIISLRTCNF